MIIRCRLPVPDAAVFDLIFDLEPVPLPVAADIHPASRRDAAVTVQIHSEAQFGGHGFRSSHEKPDVVVRQKINQPPGKSGQFLGYAREPIRAGGSTDHLIGKCVRERGLGQRFKGIQI